MLSINEKPLVENYRLVSHDAKAHNCRNCNFTNSYRYDGDYAQ